MAEDISVVVKAIDQASTTLDHIKKSVHNLDQSFGTLKGRLATGFGVAAGMAAFHLLEDGIRRLADLLPDLISKGAAWGEAVHEIGVRSGMTAEQSSLLLGVANRVGISTESLTTGMTRMAKSLGTNEKAYASLGIATRTANGQLVDAYTLFQNVRQAVAAHGAGLLSTAAAQQLFGRGGADMLRILQLNDAQFRILGMDVRNLGLVMNGQGVEAARNFSLTLERFNQTVQGVGVSIFGALGPTLTGFVEAFSNFINANLDKIVKFAVQVANFVMGVISGLFGFDFAAITVAQSVDAAGTAAKGAAPHFGSLGNPSTGTVPQATRAADALTEALKRQIAVIDRQIAAIQASENARHQANDTANLQAALAQAASDLKRLQNEAIYTGGMSNAEAVLARQKHVQDLIDARKKVSDAEKALGTSNADAADQRRIDALQKTRQALQDEMSARQAATAKMGAASAASMASSAKAIRMSFGGIGKSIGSDLTTGLKDFGTTFKDEAASALQTGKAFAAAIKDFLFGPEQQVAFSGSGLTIGIRGGGLFDKIGGLISTLVELSGHLADLVNILGATGGAVGDVGGFVKKELTGLFDADAATRDKATVEILTPFVEAGLVVMGPGGIIDQFLHGTPSGGGGAGAPGGLLPSGNPGPAITAMMHALDDPNSQMSQIVDQLRFVRRGVESGGQLYDINKDTADTMSFLPSMISTLQGIVGYGLGTAGDLYRKLLGGITTTVSGTVGVSGNVGVNGPVKVEKGALPLKIEDPHPGAVKVESGALPLAVGGNIGAFKTGSWLIDGLLAMPAVTGTVKVEKGAIPLAAAITGNVNATKTGSWLLDGLLGGVTVSGNVGVPGGVKVERGATVLAAGGNFGILGQLLGITNPLTVASVTSGVKVEKGATTLLTGVSGPINAIKSGAWNIDRILANVGVTNPGLGVLNNGTVKIESGPGTAVAINPKGGSLAIQSATGTSVAVAPRGGSMPIESATGSTVSIATASGRTVKVESGSGTSVQVNNPYLPHLPGIKAETGATADHTTGATSYAGWGAARYLWQIAAEITHLPGYTRGPVTASDVGAAGLPVDGGVTVQVFLDGQQVNGVINRIQTMRDRARPQSTRPMLAGGNA